MAAGLTVDERRYLPIANCQSAGKNDYLKKKLTLRPATLEDKTRIFNWLTNSNLTKEMLGPPNFPDAPIPSWEEFTADYVDHYFDGSQPLLGRCFIIEYNNQEIGQINYNNIDRIEKSTEIDIWLADSRYAGQGLGTEGIIVFCDYLRENLGCEKIYIAPSGRNASAIKSYKKAGFFETRNLPENFIPDYSDTIVLMKTFDDADRPNGASIRNRINYE